LIYLSDKKYLINGEKFGADDFDEDPTEIIDGEVKSDEMDEPALSKQPDGIKHLLFICYFFPCEVTLCVSNRSAELLRISLLQDLFQS